MIVFFCPSFATIILNTYRIDVSLFIADHHMYVIIWGVTCLPWQCMLSVCFHWLMLAWVWCTPNLVCRWCYCSSCKQIVYENAPDKLVYDCRAFICECTACTIRVTVLLDYLDHALSISSNFLLYSSLMFTLIRLYGSLQWLLHLCINSHFLFRFVWLRRLCSY